MKPVFRIFLTACLLLSAACIGHCASLEEDSRDYMREELGINEFTAPSISWLLKELDAFRPIPISVVDTKNFETVFPNRLQTALHFGTLIADGFIIVTNEQRDQIQDVGRALLKQSKALGVGASLTRRSNRLLELGGHGDWASLRTELVGTQKDVEDAMMELRDEQMAHMISLGGWLRGFYAGTVVTSEHYTPERAAILKKVDIIDYFIDRLETLNPRLKKTPFVTEMMARLKTIRKIAADTRANALTKPEVAEMRKLAEEINRIMVAKVDSSGNIQP